SPVLRQSACPGAAHSATAASSATLIPFVIPSCVMFSLSSMPVLAGSAFWSRCPPVQELLLRAKHLFVEAICAISWLAGVVKSHCSGLINAACPTRRQRCALPFCLTC